MLISPNGPAKLIGFGVDRVDGAHFTGTGRIPGAAPYPCLPRAGGGATASVDIYAIAVVGYHVLTGRRPFDAGTTVATALANVNQPAHLLDTIPIAMANLIGTCLALNPVNGKRGAAADAHTLCGTPGVACWRAAPALPSPGPALPVPTHATATQPPRKPDRPSRRHQTPPMGAALVELPEVIGVFGLSRLSDPSTMLDARATSSTLSPTPPSPDATCVLTPAALTSSGPVADNQSTHRRDDRTKDGKQ